MKTVTLLVAASALSASMMLAASACAQSSMPSTPPPPPGINDPGVKAVPPPASSASSPAAAPARPDLRPLALPAMKSGDSRMGRENDLPDVQVRQQGDNTVQEYSRSGRVYMVVVTPKNGIQQTYMVDPQGRLVDEHGQKPIGPVMYKVLEWGKSKPPAPASDGASPPAPVKGDDGGH